MPEDEGLDHCAECEDLIPVARRKHSPEFVCVSIANHNSKKQQTAITGINRRGSKDSQLK